MNLRTTLLLIGLLGLLAAPLRAQVIVNSDEMPVFDKTEYSPEQLAAFRKTETLLFLPAQDEAQREAIAALLRERWTITPIRVLAYGEMKAWLDKRDPAYSYLTLETFKVPGGFSTTAIFSMNLWMYSDPKKDERLTLAKILLHPTLNCFDKVKENEEEAQAHLYTAARFENLRWGMMAAYLSLVSKAMSEQQSLAIYGEFADAGLLAALRSDSLLVPDYLFRNSYGMSGFKKEASIIAPSSLMGAYPHPYRILPAAELDARIRQRPQFFLSYVHVNGSRFYMVMHPERGVAYRAGAISVSGPKAEDMEKLAAAIR